MSPPASGRAPTRPRFPAPTPAPPRSAGSTSIPPSSRVSWPRGRGRRARRCRTPPRSRAGRRSTGRAPRRRAARSGSNERRRRTLARSRRVARHAQQLVAVRRGPSPARGRSRRSRAATNWRATPESGMPRASPTARLRRSRGSPTCQSPVPALSMPICFVQPRLASTRWRITASAVGERQMLPRQTKQTRDHRPPRPASRSPYRRSRLRLARGGAPRRRRLLGGSLVVARSASARRPATPDRSRSPLPRPARPRPRPADPDVAVGVAGASARAGRPWRPRARPPATSDFSMGALSFGERISKSSTWNEPRALTTIRFCSRFSISSRNARSVVASTCATSGWTSTSTVSPSIRSPCRRSSRSSS